VLTFPLQLNFLSLLLCFNHNTNQAFLALWVLLVLRVHCMKCQRVVYSPAGPGWLLRRQARTAWDEKKERALLLVQGLVKVLVDDLILLDVVVVKEADHQTERVLI